MAVSYHVRISVPFCDLSGVIGRMAGLTDQSIAYSHTPDQGCNRVHFHLLLHKTTIKVNTVKDWITRALGYRPAVNDWSFKSTYKDKYGFEIVIDDTTYPGLITYMSKGKLSPCFVKNFDEDFILQQKNAWVEHTKVSDNPSEKSKSSKYAVKDFEGDCIISYVARMRDRNVTDEDFLLSPQLQDEMTELVKQEMYKAVEKHKFRGRLHDRLVKEIEDAIIAFCYPKIFNAKLRRMHNFSNLHI